MPPDPSKRDSLPDRLDCLPPGTAERVRLMVEASFGTGYWEGFQGYICEPQPRTGHEWRFGGQLGFGGKLHLSAGRLYVGCYPEDLTYALRKRIDSLNVRLARVVEDVAREALNGGQR